MWDIAALRKYVAGSFTSWPRSATAEGEKKNLESYVAKDSSILHTGIDLLLLFLHKRIDKKLSL